MKGMTPNNPITKNNTPLTALISGFLNLGKSVITSMIKQLTVITDKYIILEKSDSESVIYHWGNMNP